MQLQGFKRLMSACDRQQLVMLGKLSKATKKENKAQSGLVHIFNSFYKVVLS